MLNEQTLAAVVRKSLRRALDASVAADPTVIEAMAWQRWLRLANLAFRGSHMDFGAVAGYVAIRRIEVANLITVSQGIRAELPPEAIHARLIPRRIWKVEDA